MRTSAAIIVGLLLCISGFAAESRPLAGGSAANWRLFTGILPQAKSMVVYLGTPRRYANDPKPVGPTIEIHDFEFYLEPVETPQKLALQLTALVSDSQSFREYRGMKLCGGFHPDICIEWRFEENGQRWHKRAFVCLGCKEWRLIDTISAVHTDMAPAAAEHLAEIVRELRVQGG